MAPQELPALAGFLGGPRFFEKRGGSADEDSQNAIVTIDRNGHAKVVSIPQIYDGQLFVTKAHRFFFGFNTPSQTDRVYVLHHNQPEILSQQEGIRPGDVIAALDGKIRGTSLLVVHADEGVRFYPVDANGYIGTATSIAFGGTPSRLHMTQDLAGNCAFVWMEVDERRTTSTLWSARMESDGKLSARVRVDSAPELQVAADLAIVASPNGMFVIWDPIVGAKSENGSSEKTLDVALRVFRVDADARATALQTVPLTSFAGPIASVGGYVLSNYVQAVAFAGGALVTWTDRGKIMASELANWHPIEVGSADANAPAVLLEGNEREAFIAWAPTNLDVPRIDAIKLECAKSSGIDRQNARR